MFLPAKTYATAPQGRHRAQEAEREDEFAQSFNLSEGASHVRLSQSNGCARRPTGPPIKEKPSRGHCASPLITPRSVISRSRAALA
jgi:hypothetical protein